MMASEEHLLSPESSIKSLLASSGHLESSVHPAPVSLFKYREKQYSSASEALDAYISDYQKSLSAGKIQLPLVMPKIQRNRDVLRSSLSDGELSFLTLPVRRRDADQLSLTTDDLLTLPNDGSLPVTRTSALLSRSGVSFKSSSWCHSRLNHASESAIRKSINVDDLLRTPSATQQSRSLQRSDYSRLSSVPNSKHLLQLKQFEEIWSDFRKRDRPRAPRVPSWVGELEEETANIEDGNAEHLMLSVDQILSSTSFSKNRNKLDCSGDSEDALNANRSWDNPPVTFKSPVPVGVAEEPPSHQELERKEAASGSCSSGYSSRKHPGAVEALKHMLLRMQDVQHKVHPSQTIRKETDPNTEMPRETIPQAPEREEVQTGSGESLQRALHHLDRLKTLVEDMNERKGRAEHDGTASHAAVFKYSSKQDF